MTNNLRSVEELASEDWFWEKPWLVAGTGQSLENWKHTDEFNIWTINAAIDVIKYADIAALHDPIIYQNPTKFIKSPINARYILTRTCSSPTTSNTIFVQFAIDPNKDLKLHQTHNSSGFAFSFLCPRVPKIYTIGIDGGRGTFKGLKESYQHNEQREDFNAHNQAMENYVKQHGTEIIRL